jgi:hypothetical protein
LAALILAACGSGPSGPDTETPIEFAFVDPAGDTVAATANPLAVAGLDLVGVSGVLSADELSLTLEFGSPVTPWSNGAANGLDGFVHFDIDQNVSTGFIDNAHQMGVDFYLDLRDNGFGRVAVVEHVKQQLVWISATFEGTRFSVTIPRSALTLTVDPASALGLAVDLSARDRVPVVDRAPDVGSYLIGPAP